VSWMPEQASSVASDVDALWSFVLWLSVFFFVAMIGTAVWFVWRYRRSREPVPTSQVADHLGLEIAWTAIPTILLLVIFVWGFRSWMTLNVAPHDPLEIRVRAQQWAFNFEYEDGIVSDELVVPVGKPVRLLMSSRDVIHSFYVPAFRVKQDILPERYSVAWFEAIQEGEYDILCAEYCGRDHSRMVSRVKVLSQAAYDSWVDSGGGLSGLPPAEVGQRLFTRFGCNQCHSVDGSANTGPTMQGLYGRDEVLSDGSRVTADEQYLRDSILYPNKQLVQGYQPRMPSFKGSMREAQLDSIIAYLRTLQTPSAEETP
jgi:cytochrome c oxidase subunit 2